MFQVAAGKASCEFTWRGIPETVPRPDGFFSLRFPWLPDGRNTAHFFLEVDRSTETTKRYAGKLRRYLDLDPAPLGIRRFRVLTVVKSEERLASLGRAAATVSGLQESLAAFWFTSERRFAPGEPGVILGSIWETPQRPGHLQALIPSASA